MNRETANKVGVSILGVLVFALIFTLGASIGEWTADDTVRCVPLNVETLQDNGHEVDYRGDTNGWYVDKQYVSWSPAEDEPNPQLCAVNDKFLNMIEEDS